MENYKLDAKVLFCIFVLVFFNAFMIYHINEAPAGLQSAAGRLFEVMFIPPSILNAYFWVAGNAISLSLVCKAVYMSSSDNEAQMQVPIEKK